MIDSLLSIVAPHPCFGCGKTGTLLCDNCKYNIASEPFSGCFECGEVYIVRSSDHACRLPYSRSWCVGERSGELRRLIDAYKFENAYAAHHSLAQLLHECIDQLPPGTVVVPVPTAAAHVRQRGYDHTALIAKAFAKRRKLPFERLIRRRTSARQRGAGRAQRLEQARVAFFTKNEAEKNRPYLVIDDVATTGATARYAAQALKEAGASDVWVAVVARQPLD